MKKTISYFLVLVVSVTLLLVTVSADTYDDFNLSANCRLYNYAFNVNHINETVEVTNNSSFSRNWEAQDVSVNYGTRLAFSLVATGANNSIIVRKGVPFNFYIDNLCLFFEFYNSSESYSFYWNNPNTSYYLILEYTDGTTEEFRNVESSFNNFAQYISASITPSKDVSSIQFKQEILVLDLTGLGLNTVWDNLYVFGLPGEILSVSIDSESKESGLLGNIDDKIDDVINGDAEPEKSPVDDNVNDLIGEEDKLIQDTAEGRENIVTYISQAISELTAYATAFVALNAIIDEFFYLPIIGPLIVISLAMGIFAMVVNLSLSATSTYKATKSKGKGNSN